MLKKIGNWKITFLETGTFWLDGGAMMGSVPKVLWEKTNAPDDKNRIKLALRCLLLDNGESRVLIESGIGNKFDSKFSKMFSISQSKEPLCDALSDNGYSYKDITHVILTHLHFDHAGGIVKINSDGQAKPVFPNAKHYISRENWDAGINPNPRDRASYLKENYVPVHDRGLFEFVLGNSEILPGISTYVVNGHTKGQQLIKIDSDDETLVFCSDLIPLESHLRLPWIMGYDLNADLTLKEKTEFLNLASSNNWWLFFYHDPETIAVKIKEDGKYYKVIEKVSIYE